MNSSAINVGRLKLTEYKLLVDSQHIYRSETPVSELVELSDLFLQNFQHPPPPISTLSQHASASDPVILLCRCNSRSIKPMSDLIRNTAFSPLHTPRIKALWPLFWRWAQDLFLHPLEKENLSPLVLTTLFQSGIHESRESTFTTCSGFLDALKGPDPGLVIEMPGFISSYLYWWRFSSLQPGNPDASPVLLQYLCNMFQRLYGFMPSYSSIERELGPASDFVTSALGSIRVTMDQETLINGIRRFDNFDLGQALHVMQYHPSSVMHAEFVRQGSIELVVDILKTLPTRALRESPEIQTFTISTIFEYLVKVYSLPHGKDHIQRAIECDIILALCDIAQRGHLRDPSAEFTKAAIQLFKILYSQIPFSHNLRIARKSIRPITLSEASIVNHWSLIVSLVRYISPLQHTYKLTTGKACNVCGGQSEPSKSLKKCARCGVRYCSRTCQRSDWDAVHRKLCPPEMAAHQPDGHWLTSINTDILKRSKEKITLLFQKYALIDEQADRPPHVAISVNYFAHPITISSETIDEEYSENTKPGASLIDFLDVTTVIPINASENTVLKVELERNLCPEPPYYTREEFLEQSVGDDDDLMKIRAEITRIEDILGEPATQSGADIPIVFEDSGDWDTGDISH